MRGNIRLPGTRQLDPVTVLQVRSADGTIIYQEGADLQKQQVVDSGQRLDGALDHVRLHCTLHHLGLRFEQ